MGTFTGIDVSQYQGNINWGALKQAVSFVIFKGTGGDDGLYADGQFLNNLANVRGTGFDYGIYHFGGTGDAATEANYFYQQCLTNLEVGVPVILDAEAHNALDPNWCLAFLQHLEGLIGFKPMIYMSQNLMLTKDWSAVASNNYGLWLADWNGDPNIVVQMRYWSFCAIQQYKDNGQVAGVAGNVDVDAFFAQSMDVWHRYGKPAPVAPPAPPKETPSEPTKPVTPPVAPTPPAETKPTEPTSPPVEPPVEPKPSVQEPTTPPASQTPVSPVQAAPQTSPKVVVPNPTEVHKHYTFWQLVMSLLRKVFGSWL